MAAPLRASTLALALALPSAALAQTVAQLGGGAGSSLVPVPGPRCYGYDITDVSMTSMDGFGFFTTATAGDDVHFAIYEPDGAGDWNQLASTTVPGTLSPAVLGWEDFFGPSLPMPGTGNTLLVFCWDGPGVEIEIDPTATPVTFPLAGGNSADAMKIMVGTPPPPVLTAADLGADAMNLTMHLRFCVDEDGDGVSDCDGDCDDLEPATWPGAPQLCDGIVDNDCDGVPDPNEADADADAFTVCAGDCDDFEPAAFPGNPEVCDGVPDNDCDGVVDPGELDDDGDGFTACTFDCDDSDPGAFPGNPATCDGVPDSDCDRLIDGDELDFDGDGFTVCDGDCDDLDPATWPGAPEVCDRADNDCDGVIPAAETTDGDGDGSPLCEDCDDADPARSPGFTEVCDGIDNDCDGSADGDGDGDGWGVCAGDCDDGDPGVSPGVSEVCNAVDDDCNGVVDDVGGVATDADGDGWLAACGDCDDGNPGIRPFHRSTPPFAGDTSVGDGLDIPPAPFFDTDCDGLNAESGFDGARYFAVVPGNASTWADAQTRCWGRAFLSGLGMGSVFTGLAGHAQDGLLPADLIHIDALFAASGASGVFPEVWIGLRSQGGAWFWEDATGAQVPAVFIADLPPVPADGLCATQDAAATWNARPCTDLHGMVCAWD